MALNPFMGSQTGRNVNGVGRAVSRLASRQPGIRRSTLAWLQQTARSREPEHLLLKRATDLVPLVRAAREHEVRRPAEKIALRHSLAAGNHHLRTAGSFCAVAAGPPSDACETVKLLAPMNACAGWDHLQIPGIEDVLVEAVGALAAAPANVAVILDAAALEPLLEALSGPSSARAATAAHALGLLAREDDARLSTLSPAPLQVGTCAQAVADGFLVPHSA